MEQGRNIDKQTFKKIHQAFNKFTFKKLLVTGIAFIVFAMTVISLMHSTIYTTSTGGFSFADVARYKSLDADVVHDTRGDAAGWRGAYNSLKMTAIKREILAKKEKETHIVRPIANQSVLDASILYNMFKRFRERHGDDVFFTVVAEPLTTNEAFVSYWLTGDRYAQSMTAKLLETAQSSGLATAAKEARENIVPVKFTHVDGTPPFKTGLNIITSPEGYYVANLSNTDSRQCEGEGFLVQRTPIDTFIDKEIKRLKIKVGPTLLGLPLAALLDKNPNKENDPK